MRLGNIFHVSIGPLLVSGMVLASQIVSEPATAQSNRYAPWRGAAPQQSRYENQELRRLVEELQGLIDEAERARAADPRFLQDLKDLVQSNISGSGYDTPAYRSAPPTARRLGSVAPNQMPAAVERRREPSSVSRRPYSDQTGLDQPKPGNVYLQDDFTDGNFTHDPAWTVAYGRFQIQPGFGLRTIVGSMAVGLPSGFPGDPTASGVADVANTAGEPVVSVPSQSSSGQTKDVVLGILSNVLKSQSRDIANLPGFNAPNAPNISSSGKNRSDEFWPSDKVGQINRAADIVGSVLATINQPDKQRGDAAQTPAQAPSDIAVQGLSAGSKAGEPAEIFTFAPIANAFALSIQLRAKLHTINSEIRIGVFQNIDRLAGYKLSYVLQGKPSLRILRISKRGSVVVDSAILASGLENEALHRLDWVRDNVGNMAVMLDGMPVLNTGDTGFRHPFDGIHIVNLGGDFAIQDIQVKSPDAIF